jgi:hypothetical protein
MNWKLYLSALALLAFARPGAAQTTLEWELEETAYLEVRHTSTQSITVLGRTKETQNTIRFVFKVRPTKVGRAATTYEITIVACEDVATTKGEAPEKDALKGFRGQKFRLTATTGNQNLELVTPKELPDAVFGDDFKDGTAAEKQFAADLADAILRVHLLDAFVPLPEKAVAPGDKWNNKAVVKVPPLAQATTTREYALVGRQIHEGKPVQAIHWTSTIDLKPLPDENGLLPFKVKQMKVLVKPQYEGTVLWDASAKRPLRVDCVQTYNLELLMDIDGRETKGNGKGTDAFVIRFFATNPDEKKRD